MHVYAGRMECLPRCIEFLSRELAERLEQRNQPELETHCRPLSQGSDKNGKAESSAPSCALPKPTFCVIAVAIFTLLVEMSHGATERIIGFRILSTLLLVILSGARISNSIQSMLRVTNQRRFTSLNMTNHN